MSAGSLDLGELYAKLAIDYSDLHKAELSARQFATNANKELDKIRKGADALKTVGKNMSTYVTAPLVGAGVASMKFATDFDKAVREVNSLLDAKDQNFEGLKDQIRGVSLELGTDLVESAKAAYSALGAGVPKDNLIEFLTVASKSAIGGVTSVETAVDGFTSVMNAWGKSAGNVTEVSDVMFQAVKYGKVTFEQFASSISLTSGMAAEFGVSFKEVAAYSALATAQGEKQTVAMTQMRQAISELVKPNKELGQVIKDAGIKSIKTTLAQKGLAKTWDILRKSADKNGTSLEKSIGSIEALQYVLRNTGKNAENSAEFLNKMSDAVGANDAAFKELDKARGFDKLVNNLKALATIIGDQLLPVVLPIVEKFTRWVVIASNLDPGLTRLAVSIAAVAAAVGPLLMVSGSLLGMMAGGGGLMATVRALAGLLMGPVGIAFAAAAAAGVLIYKNWQPLKTFFAEFVSTNAPHIESIKGSFASLGTELSNTGKQIMDMFSGVSVSSLQASEDNAYFASSWAEFGEGILSMVEIVVEELTWFYEQWKGIGYDLAEIITTNSEAFVKWGGEIVGIVKKTATDIVLAIKNIDWKQLGVDMMVGLKNGIVEASPGVIGTTVKALEKVVEGAKIVVDSNSPSKVFMGIGKDLMDGLGIGITTNTSSAVAAMMAAGDTLNNAAKEKLTQDKFRGFEAELMLNSGTGRDGTNFELELAKEQAYYDRSKAMLDEAQALKLSSITSYASMRQAIEEKHTSALIDIGRQSLQATVQSLDASLMSLEQYGQKQSLIYKGIFAVSKAFAIAEAMLAMQQNIAKASTVGFPWNIPFIAGAIAQGTSIISNVTGIAGAFNNGGYIPTGQIGMVGEKGPEFVSGPANVFSTQNTKEAMRGGGSGTKVNVSVMNYGNSKVEVSESGSDKEKQISIIIDRVKQSIASDAIRGDGMVDKTFASVFKLPRTG